MEGSLRRNPIPPLNPPRAPPTTGAGGGTHRSIERVSPSHLRQRDAERPPSGAFSCCAHMSFTNMCSCSILPVQLALDSLDRLVELLEERGGRVRASEAAAHLFAVKQAPEGLARQLLGPLVEGDPRLAW